MENIKKFEPVFGEWSIESLVGAADGARFYKAFREKDGKKEYCLIKHIPVPTDEETVKLLISDGMEESVLSAYVDDRLRAANRELAIAERLGGAKYIAPYFNTETVAREEGRGYDVLIGMQFTDTLEQMAEKRPITRGETLKLGRDIASAIEDASAQGIVHRNISPENILVGDEGFMLTGLGTARAVGSVEGDELPTGAYTAPEVIKGEPYTEASDVYSLGLILYRSMNRGRMPFLPNAPEPYTQAQYEAAALRRIAGAELPLPAGARDDFGRAIVRACAYSPDERLSASELREALEAVASGAVPVIPDKTAPQAAREAKPAAPVIPEVKPEAPAVPEVKLETPVAQTVTAEIPETDIPKTVAPETPVAQTVTAEIPVTEIPKTVAPAAPVKEQPQAAPAAAPAAAPSAADMMRAALASEAGRVEETAAELPEKGSSKREKRMSRKEKREKLRAELEAEAEEIDEPEFDEGPEPEPEEERSGRGLKAGIIIAAIIAGLALLGVLAILIKNGLEEYNAEKEAHAFKPRPPEIVQDAADKDIYHVTIFAENGTAVTYEKPNGIRLEYQVNNDNRIVFDVKGSDMIPNEPLDSTAYSAQPKFYTRNANGDLDPVADMGYIMLEIPQLTVTLDSEGQIYTENGDISFSGTVSEPLAELTIDGEPYEIGADGRFIYNKSYEENGDYEIAIEARKARFCTYTGSVSVRVDIPEPPAIMLPWDLEETNYSQRVTDPDDTVEVHGMVPAGSIVTLSCENELVLLSEPEVTEDGAFSFTATLPEIGDYTVLISCEGPDGPVSREVHVQRAPVWKPYVESAWAMSYDALTRPSKQCYNIKGTITQIIEHIDYYLVAIETSNGNTLLLEYHYHYPSSNTFVLGKEYKWIYGYPMGKNAEGAPVVYVWFVNDK